MTAKEFDNRRLALVRAIMLYRARNVGSKPEQWLLQLSTAELGFKGSRRVSDRLKAIEAILLLEDEIPA